MRLNSRLTRLEARRPRDALGQFVFESIEAAQLAGATGGVLVIGPPLGRTEWEAAAKVQQAALAHCDVEQMRLLPPTSHSK